MIYVDSLSKTLGGGLRVGWVAASGPVLDRIVAEKRADDIHSPTLTQLALARYLATGAYAGQVERARAFYRERLAAMLESIEKHLGPIAGYVEPLGGGHIWLELDLAVDERELADEAVRQGVAYVPGGAMRVDAARPGSRCALSFGYLEPERDRRGRAPAGAAIRALRGARRAAGRSRSDRVQAPVACAPSVIRYSPSKAT